MGSLMNGEVLPRPSVHFVAHVFSLHGIVKLDSDYSEAGLITSFVEVFFRLKRNASSRCVDSISTKTIILNN